MDNENNSNELLKLLSDACDERLDRRSRRQLEEILIHDEEARRVFAHYVQMHSSLEYLVTSDSALQNALKDLSLYQEEGQDDLHWVGGEKDSPAMTSTGDSGVGVVAVVAPTERSPSVGSVMVPLHDYRFPAGRIATAAILLIGVVAFWLVRSGSSPLVAFRQPQPIASIDHVENARWSSPSVPVAGDSLLKGQTLELEEGVAFVSMGSGAELVMQAPCSVKLQSAHTVTLLRGNLTVQVAEWARGFEVVTSTMNIVDLGTKFCVSANNSGSVEAHVVEGQIRVEPLTSKPVGRRSLLLSVGESVRVDLQGDTSRRLGANYVGFVTNIPQLRPYKPIPIHNTGVGLEWGDEDSHWRITTGTPGGDYSGPQHAVVCRPEKLYLPNVPEQSQWIAATEKLLPGCTHNSVYTFETHFDLTGYDLSTVTISGQLLADNGVKEVRINGQPVAMTPWIDNAPEQRFHRFRKVEIKHGLIAGKNKIEIIVWNGSYLNTKSQLNPMALRAEWDAYGRPIALKDSI